MSSPSDEAAAERAATQGEGRARVIHHPRLYAIEPAAGSKRGYAWVECPSLYFLTKRPVCERCGEEVGWLGPAERRPDPMGGDSFWVYRVCCLCDGAAETGEVYVDEIVSGFPLRMGGTRAFWDRYRSE